MGSELLRVTAVRLLTLGVPYPSITGKPRQVVTQSSGPARTHYHLCGHTDPEPLQLSHCQVFIPSSSPSPGGFLSWDLGWECPHHSEQCQTESRCSINHSGASPPPVPLWHPRQHLFFGHELKLILSPPPQAAGRSCSQDPTPGHWAEAELLHRTLEHMEPRV